MNHFKIKTQLGWMFANLDTLPMSCGCEGTLKEWLADDLEAQCGEPVEILVVRELHRHQDLGTRLIRLYYSHRQYGGPEEGGWWYNAEQTERTYTVPAKNYHRHLARLQRFCDAANKDLAAWDSGAAIRVTGRPEAKRERPHYC